MTNKHDEGEPSKDCNPRLAALLAVHLVSQVLDEAHDIVNAAQESGQPWRYLSMLKNFKNSGIGFADDKDELVEASKGDSMKSDIEMAANIVATSTPQKAAVVCSEETLTAFNDSTFIGQGDEEIERQQSDLTNSTSMYINNLFDMSEIEQVILCDNEAITQSTSEPSDLQAEAMNKIMDTYVANAFQSIEDLPVVMGSFIANPFSPLQDLPPGIEQININENVEGPAETLSKSDHSSEYSFLADAFVADIGRDVTFYIEEGPSEKNEVYENLRTATVVKRTELADIKADNTEKEIIKQKSEFSDKEADDTEKEVLMQKNEFPDNKADDTEIVTLTQKTVFSNNEADDTEKEALMQKNEFPDNKADDTEIVTLTQKTVFSNNEADDTEKEAIKQTNDFLEADDAEKQPTIQKNEFPDREADDTEKVPIKQKNEFSDREPDDNEKKAIKQNNGFPDNVADDTEKEATKQKNDFQLYENAYMTLNRDYDQCSEDDGFPILQDPKEVILQEVELMTANTSDEELICAKASVSKPIEEVATVSGNSGSRKTTLARRCRNQGARLFACLRGWWRRKIPMKRKESRRLGLAVCPLSPNARRRSSSLLDNRLPRSPSPSRPVMWKFNTVNEALVNSNRWKDYTFDVLAEGSGDL